MIIDRYFQELQVRIDAIKANPEPLLKAARFCADAMAKGGYIHIFDSGHLVSHELINRAGGLVAISRLGFSLTIENPVRARPDQPLAPDNTLSFGYIDHVLDSNQIRKGDVLFVGSVSGKTPNVVELAIKARQRGLTVIAITAMNYSPRLAAEHPSGKKLYEVADLVLDNCAPYGDGMLEVEGLDYNICPASGLGAVIVMWAVVAGIVEEMLGRGLKPTIFPSVNRPDGKNLVSQVEAEAMKKGY